MYPDFLRRPERELYYSGVGKVEVGKVNDESEDTYEELMQVDKVGSEGGTLYVKRNTDTNEIHIRRGCFSGSLEEFEERVKRKPVGDKHRKIYEQLIEVIKLNYAEVPKGMIRHKELLSGHGHVNYCYNTDSILFASTMETNQYKTRFTWQEAYDIAKKLGIKITKANSILVTDAKLVWEEV